MSESRILSPEDILAIGPNWTATNARRGSLIDKKFTQQGLTPEETAELDYLQNLAGLKRATGMKAEMEKLEKAESYIKRRGLEQRA